MQINSGHLTYCTNIHAGESWDEHFASLRKNFPAIKERVSPDAPMGIGLRASHLASLNLIQPENLQAFREWLKEAGAYVFTMNGFPYGGFHHTRVKDQVHAPDWTTQERVDYTIRLFRILSELLPGGMDGGVSTSPLTYRHWFNDEESLSKARQQANANILLVVEELIRLREEKNVILHLDVEPEPDGMLETGEEFIAWYEEFLDFAKPQLSAKLGLSEAEAEQAIREHVTLCYDVCHFAIGYEDHEQTVAILAAKGIKVGKIQISAAVKAALAEDPEGRRQVIEAFTGFNEPTYLHQVVARKKDGSVLRYPDLPEALEDAGNPEVAAWRAHFHVPIFISDFGVLQSTNNDIRQILELQLQQQFTKHLEVETYTWEVLPENLKLPIDQSIARELEWVKQIAGEQPQEIKN